MYWIYSRIHGLKSERSYAPQLIKFNIPTNDWIPFLALGGTGVFISGIVNPIINSVKFLFWVSIVTAITEILGDIWGIFNDVYLQSCHSNETRKILAGFTDKLSANFYVTNNKLKFI